MCLCEPCPEGTVMCISSGACIDEKLWCDGFEDCPDDEINCQRKAPTITASQNQETSNDLVFKTTNKLILIKLCFSNHKRMS